MTTGKMLMQLSISSKIIPPAPGQTLGTQLEGRKTVPPRTIIVYKNPPPGQSKEFEDPTSEDIKIENPDTI